MKLSEFIRNNKDEIVHEWERFARTCLPAAEGMQPEELRNHAADLLAFIATDMDTPQTGSEQASKSWGHAARSDADTDAERHAILRVADGFTIEQVVGEFRALRASVLHMGAEKPLDPHSEEITRFNECIDQLLAESVVRHAEMSAERVRRESRQKDEFISALSHELRNPVGAISSAVQVLNVRGSTDPVSARAVDILTRQTGHLARLLDDILDVARISRGRVTLKMEPVDLRGCVQDAVEGNKQLFEEMEHDISVDMPSEPVIMHIDCTRVAQVLANLINNAAKYSPPRSTLRVALQLRSDEAEIAVCDNGIGIEPHLLPHMFEAFYISDSGNHGKRGLGIGLWLSRQLIEMQGGRITVHSDGPGTGAVFRIRLPILFIPIS
jgi:signal transduction histidine kinase